MGISPRCCRFLLLAGGGVVAISSRDPYPLPLVLQSPIDPDPLQPLPAAGGEEQGPGAVAAATAVTTCDKCGEKYNLTIMAIIKI